MSLVARGLNTFLRHVVKRRLGAIRELHSGLVAAVRANVEDTRRWQPSPPRGLIDERVQAGGVPALQVRAAGADSDRAVLYLHGGAYLCGSAAVYRDLASRLSQACRAAVLVVDYRLAPEHPFPAALEDSRTALAWLCERVAPEHLAVAGDSAGGGLALATLLAERDAGRALPACAVTFSAWTDLAGTGESLRTNARSDPWLEPALLPPTAAVYLADADPRHPLASPLYGDPQRLPPLLMHAVTSEILLDDTRRFAAGARAAGVAVEERLWKGLPHAFPVFAPLLAEGRDCIRQSGHFIRRCWQEASAG